MTESKAVAKKEEKSLSSIGIKGLFNFDSTDLPMPRVRLVQPTSQKAILADGTDAKPGTFYFSISKIAKEELELIVLSAKKDTVQWESDPAPQMIYRIMGVERGKTEPFVMSIAGTSMWEWRNILGLLSSLKAEHIWDYPIKLTSEKREGEKGKWHIMQFKLGEKLPKDEVALAESILERFSAPIAADDLGAPDKIDLDDLGF